MNQQKQQQNQESKLSIIPFSNLLEEAQKLNGEYPTLIVFIDKTRHITTLLNFMRADSEDFTSMVEHLMDMKLQQIYEKANIKGPSTEEDSSTPSKSNATNEGIEANETPKVK